MAWLLVALVLCAGASRFEFHGHEDGAAEHHHRHHHVYDDHHRGAAGDDPDAQAAAFHGHDSSVVSTSAVVHAPLLTSTLPAGMAPLPPSPSLTPWLAPPPVRPPIA